MPAFLDPKAFNLSPRTVIEETGKNRCAIVISRKSRFIMADGRIFLEKVRKIQDARPAMKVSLKISSPLCSKTRAYLKDHGIQIIQ